MRMASEWYRQDRRPRAILSSPRPSRPCGSRLPRPSSHCLDGDLLPGNPRTHLGDPQCGGPLHAMPPVPPEQNRLRGSRGHHRSSSRRLAGRSPSGSGNSHDNQAVSLIEVCQVLANITVRVNPLTSGYSRDVHGVVHVTALPVQPSKTALLGSATGENGMRLLEESYTFKTTPPGTIHSHMLVNDRI